MNTPLISIIMACYNQAAYISEAIDSLLCQTFHNWEAIIIDDGSTDNIKSVLQPYLDRDSRIIYIRQDNQGPSSARNNGVKYSRGKYILPFDSDDILSPTYIEKGVAFLEEHPDYSVFCCKVKMFGATNKIFEIHYTDYKQELLKNQLVVSSIFRRTDFDRIGGFDESFLTGTEDWDFFIRLLYHNSKVKQSQEILFYYRIKKISRNHFNKSKRDGIEITLFKKHIEKYIEFFGNPLEMYRDTKWKQRYYNEWYRKLWYKLTGKKRYSPYDVTI